MRQAREWRKELAKEMSDHLPKGLPRGTPGLICDVELGLTLLKHIAPQSEVESLWVLLAGHKLAIPECTSWTHLQNQKLGNARYRLFRYSRPYPWKRALEQYAQLEERFRAFNLDLDTGVFTARQVSLCYERLQVYEQTLLYPAPFEKNNKAWAKAGNYRFAIEEKWAEVEIPESLVFEPPRGHCLDGVSERAPLEVTWDELIQTAEWMQQNLRSKRDWVNDIKRVNLELVNQTTGVLEPSSTLTIHGLLHMIGMVSAGKSTLMDVLTVWAAKEKNLRVTLVVGDVMGVLDRCKLFADLGLSVAPILGTERKGHLKRFQQNSSTENLSEFFQQDQPGSQWLGTTCLLDGLRKDDTPIPIPLGREPCASLQPVSLHYEEEEKYLCPMYAQCPRHQASKDAVGASIWVATPASLLNSAVPIQLNNEKVRYLELSYRTRDLIIVDEADRVQIQLDAAFCPNVELIGGSEPWLGNTLEQVAQSFNRKTRGQLEDSVVAQWVRANDIAQNATNQMYRLLLDANNKIAETIRNECFTGWTILENLARELADVKKDQKPQDNFAYVNLMKVIRNFIDHPLDKEGGDLATIGKDLITGDSRKELRKWLKQHAVNTLEESSELWLEFGILTTILGRQLDNLVQDWNYVLSPLELKDTGITLERPPRDYEPLVPTAAIGNLLAFQYRTPFDSDEGGTLSFFRFVGMGRWLLSNLHQLCPGDDIAGPNVLLLSGTSWAGTSPAYHIDVPVGGVLHAPKREVDAIKKSEFFYHPLYTADGTPIIVSGKRAGRLEALESMVFQLAKQSGTQVQPGPSWLEQVRDQQPHYRQRLLLLVGSYDEAEHTYHTLTKLRPEWRGQLRYLVRDTTHFAKDENGGIWKQENDDATLARGLVGQFAKTGAWLLVAPLLAVERGHNILNEYDVAAIGAVLFLVRPHPRPDDLNYFIYSLNRWAVNKANDAHWLAQRCQPETPTLLRAGEKFRASANYYWDRLLSTPLIYRTLPNEMRDEVTWTQLVTLWQVIGRLVRGGQPAQVYFCDAAFAPNTARQEEFGDNERSSLLVGMRNVLREVLESNTKRYQPWEHPVAQALYGPLYTALETLGGLHDTAR